jgi:hypothetical protein
LTLWKRKRDTMATTLIALYDNFETATDVVDDLQAAGFPSDTISMVTNDASGEYQRYVQNMDIDHDDEDVDAGEGAVAGAVLGGLIGLGVAIIPGIGPVLAAGPLAALLAGGVVGAAAGAATGGIVAALVNLNMTEDEAGYYAEGVRRGGTLVVVNVSSDEMVDRAEDIMEDYDPVDIEERTRNWRETGWMGYDPEAEPYTRDELNRERARYGLSDYDRAEMADVDRIETVGGEMQSERLWENDEFETYEPYYRTHFNTYYSGTGYDYDRYRPAYQYGYTLATRPEYRDRNWTDLEEEAHRDWEQRTHHGAWEDVKEAVREGWQRIKQSV